MSTIVQISDCHLFEDRQKCGYQNINPFQNLVAILGQALSHNPDILLVTGDISGDDSQKSYQHFLQLIEQHQLLTKLHVIPGNHDNNPWFDVLLGKYDLSKQAPAILSHWSIHGVDTRYKGTLGKLDQTQLNRLEYDLETTQAQFHLVACHHHPINCGGWMDRHEWVNADTFMKLISRRNKVKAVTYGHIHTEHVTWVNNQLFTSCPSSCWQWSRQPEFAVAADLAGYNLIQLQQTGEISIQTHRLNNKHIPLL